jgi:hypothetical protein
MSDNHLHYSWNWGEVHLLMLGVYPGTEGDCASGNGIAGKFLLLCQLPTLLSFCDIKHALCLGNGCAGAPWGWHSPEHSLDFLVNDLKQVSKTTPVVLFMHYGIKGFGSPGQVPWSGYSPDFWWSTREAMQFAHAIAGWNVVAIVHGHTHACVFYQWDLSNVTGYKYDLYNAPALQKGGKNDPPGSLGARSQYLVFEIETGGNDTTSTSGNAASTGGNAASTAAEASPPPRPPASLRAFQRVGDGWGTITHEKEINATASTAKICEKLTTELSQVAVGAVRVRAAGEAVVPQSHVV